MRRYFAIVGTVVALSLALTCPAWAQFSPSFPAFIQNGAGAVARAWIDKVRDDVHVKDYGAKCDGVTDDAAAINLAINSIPIGGSGRLRISGTCAFASQLVFNARRWVVEGNGTLGTKLLWTGATNATAIKFTSDVGGTGNTFYAIRNLSIVNNVALGTTKGLLLTSNASGSNSGQAVIEQVLINGFQDCLAIGESGGQASSEITMINFVGQNCTNGVHVDAAASNSLNINGYNISLSLNSIGWLASSPGTSGQYIYGGSFSGNTSADFDFESGGIFSIHGVRSENGNRFLFFGGTSGFTHVSLISNQTNGANLNADNAEVKANLGNFHLVATGNQFRGNFDLNSSTGEATAFLAGNSTQQATLMTTNGDVTYRHFGNYKHTAGGLFSAYFPDRVGSQRGGTALDVLNIPWQAGVPVGLRLPLSTGATTFAIDGDQTGISIANNGTATPFGNSNIFSGMFLVSDTNGGEAALFLTGNGHMTLVSQTATNYSVTSGTASKINVFLTANVVTVENKLGATSEVRVLAFRTRNRE